MATRKPPTLKSGADDAEDDDLEALAAAVEALKDLEPAPKPSMTLTMVDGTVMEVFVLPADRVSWERRYGMPLGAVERPLEEHTLYLAFVALQRRGYTPPGAVFETWIQSVAAVL